MTQAPSQPASPPAAPGAIWRPALRPGSAWAKAAAGAALAGLLGAWMAWQWANGMVRVLAGVLIAITLWATGRGALDDLARQRRRQVRIERGVLYVTTTDSALVIHVEDISSAHWREELDVSNGLWLYGREQRVLAHLGTGLLADRAQARAFVAWVQTQTNVSFEVKWPRP